MKNIFNKSIFRVGGFPVYEKKLALNVKIMSFHMPDFKSHKSHLILHNCTIHSHAQRTLSKATKIKKPQNSFL